MTRRELAIVLREFHPRETHFFSFFLKTLSYHQKHFCGSLLNAKETLMKLSLRLTFMSNRKMSISLQAIQLTKKHDWCTEILWQNRQFKLIKYLLAHHRVLSKQGLI